MNKYPKISYVAKASPNDELCIGDTIHIKHPLCTIDAQVFSYTYDTIAKKVTEIVFGNYKPTARRAVANIKNEITETNKRIKDQEKMIQNQTDLINSQFKNGYIVIDENELLILDELPKEKAKNVWRFNMGGLGHSKNGYLGPFPLAITQDGKINADYILAGVLRGISVISDDGSIGGWNINPDGLYNGVIKINNAGTTNIYTWADLYIIRLIVGGVIDPDEDMISHYDFNEDGKITSMDYVLLKNRLKSL